MARPNWWQRAAALAAAAVAGCLLAACATPAKDQGQGTDPGGHGQLGSSPTAGSNGGAGFPDGAPSGNPTGGGQGNTGGAAASPTPFVYPKDAKAYAQAVLTAWGNKDLVRVALLTTPAALQQIKDNGYPDNHWTYIKSDGAAGSTYCTFRNNNGDEVVIRVTNSLLGLKLAVSEAPLERTTYPTNAHDYVNAFLNAWSKGNLQRMRKYAADDAYANATVTKPPLSGSIPAGEMDYPGYVEITIRTPEFVYYKFKVLKPQGGPDKLSALPS